MFSKNILGALIISVLSYSVFAAEPGTAVCDIAKLAEIEKMIRPDLGMNSDFIIGLLDGAQSGALKCEIKSTSIPITGMLGSCGYAYPKAKHQVSVSNAYQTWTMFVREDEVECGGAGFWLTSIKSQFGDFSKYVTSGDKIIGQVDGTNCGNLSHYIAVKFSFQNENEQLVKVTKVLNVDQNSACATPTLNGGLVELSAAKLGVDPADLK